MSSDLEFLGLVADGEPGRYRFTVQNHLARLDARLYGGTAIAVSLAAAELVSERAPLWMTTQFVSTAPAEAEIAVHAEVLAPGRRTNQVRVTATDAAGEIMFASLGATGRPREEGLTGTFEHAVVSPRVTSKLIEVAVPHLGGADPDVEARLFVLSEPERDVFLLVGRGLTNTEIAQSIHLSESTVKAHFGRILDKLALSSRVQAVILAYELGVVGRGA